MFLQDVRVPYDPLSHADARPVERPQSRLSLVMPMAGRGSRFADGGAELPKPLIELEGKPFFWWAAESVGSLAPVAERVFVVLDEHVRRFAIDEAVLRFYPDARIVVLPGVTEGAAETAAIGLRALEGGGPVAICDSDHAFACNEAGPLVDALRGGTDAALLCFSSASPAYSYVELDGEGAVAGTVEKRAVSPFAIAGCYLFASPATYLEAYESYRLDCPYAELFVSGLYNRLIASGARVERHLLDRHVSFGTPEELRALLAAPDALERCTAGR